MDLQTILQQFIEGMKQTTWLEYIAVFTGIASVWFEKNENIWVFPVGLINTIIYIWISIKGNLFGEASVNFYYTVVKYLWLDFVDKKRCASASYYKHSIFKCKAMAAANFVLCFFLCCIFFILTYLKKSFAPNAIPWADAFASATAYTGMWLMAKKKVESWYWWIATNIASIPLYFVKHYVFISVYYLILLIMAFFGLIEWMKRAVNSES